MRESDIMYQNGNFWIAKDKNAYTVLRCKLTHSVTDSSYEKTDDGFSIAKARCDYLAKRYSDQK